MAQDDFTPDTKPDDFVADDFTPDKSVSQPAVTEQPKNDTFAARHPILNKLFAFDPGMFKSMLESTAHPQSLSDLAPLMMPSTIGEIPKISKILRPAKVSEELPKLPNVGDVELPSSQPKLPEIDTPLEPKLKSYETNAGPSGTPIPLGASTEAPKPDTVDRLKYVLKNSAQPAQERQTAINAAERARRFAEASQVTDTGESGFKQRLSAMSGAYDKAGFNPLRPELQQNEVDDLFKTINTNPRASDPIKLRSGVALTKLLDGKALQQNEIDLLDKQFGIGEQLSTMNPSMRRRVMEYTNLPKTLVTGLMHFSAPFRQGAQSIYDPAWWSSWNDMFKSFGSEVASQAVDDAIKGSKLMVDGQPLNTYEMGQRGGLFLADLRDSLSGREDELYSNLAQKWKIPGTDIQPYRASARAFKGFLNPLRQGQYDSIVKDAIEAAKLKGDKLADPRYNDALNEAIAGYVNSATGHGSLGPAEKYTDLLNTVMFSPRMKVGRLQTINTALNPLITQNPVVRKAALKGLLSLGSLGLSVASLGKLAGGDVSLDPTSADFAKVKIGDTRVDPWAGDQQMAVLAAKLIAGGYTSTATNQFANFGDKFGSQTAGGAVLNFLNNQLSPSGRFVSDLAFKHLVGSGANRKSSFQLLPNDQDVGEALKLITPILMQNLYEVARDNPGLIPSSVIIPANTFGVGMETYGSNSNPNQLRPLSP